MTGITNITVCVSDLRIDLNDILPFVFVDMLYVTKQNTNDFKENGTGNNLPKITIIIF